MSSAGRHQVASPPPAQDGKEIDSVKESISDIINQLQDIDPARLSFSPFLDLDTQISLAPVSDSPESSVEELHSPSSPPHSATGSQHSLDAAPPPAAAPPNQAAARTNLHKGCDPCSPQQQQQHSIRPTEEPRGSDRGKEEDRGVPAAATTPPAAIPSSLDGPAEKHMISSSTPDRSHTPRPPPDAVIPNGTDAVRWSPESTALDSTTGDEGRPLIGGGGRAAESVELTLWGGPDVHQHAGTCEEGGVDAAADAQQPPRRHCCCRCCGGGRVPALCSGLASLLCSAGILYALYYYVPIRPPDCPDLSSRLVFALCCCAVASLPILLAMLVGAVCQLCSSSLDPVVEPLPRRQALHRLFVSGSMELLALYVLNLVVLVALLPEDQADKLRLVPMLAAMFLLGRFVYWVSLHACSSWRGLGSGLTLFPLLALVALNLYCMYCAAFRLPPFGQGSQDLLYNQQQATPTAWPPTTSRWDNGQSLPTDVLDTQ